MHIILFIFYSILCGYGILKLKFLRRTGIRPMILLLFFAIHVAVGCIHNVIAWRYFPGHGDTWDSFQWSLLLRNWLHTDFQHFLAANSRWTYFTHNGIIFIQLLLNFLSFDNLYINTLLFAFPVFLGNAALYRVLRRHFPACPLTAIVVFLLPSTLFWTACVFREGVLYMLLGFLFYQLDLLLSPSPSYRPGRATAWACCCFILILYFRFAVGILLVPALLAWIWNRNRSRRLFAAVAAIALVALGAILAFPPVPHWFLNGLSRWQSQFQVLEGHSRLFLPAMDGSWRGLFRTTPYALLNGLFQPLPGAGGRTIYLAFSTELVFIWTVIAVAATRAAIHLFQAPPSFVGAPAPSSPAIRIRSGFVAACVIFALLGMIAVGAIVPFAGAIVRYRSIYLPFLLAPALHSLRDLPLIKGINGWLGYRL